jgi:ATP-dependent DNA helicase RecQ
VTFKAFILDLDGTLINTDALHHLRSEGRWREIPRHFRECSVYHEVVDLLNTARAVGMKVALFTNSPSSYVKDLLKHFRVDVDFVVAYHDVRQHKPNREGIDKVLDRFGLTANEAVFLGDSDLNRDAAANAGIEFFAVDWGSVTNLDATHFGIYQLAELIGSQVGQNRKSSYRAKLQQTDNQFYLGFYLQGIKQEIWSFKDGSRKSVERWTQKAVEIADSLPPVDIIVRALGHAELGASNADQPLDFLASHLARALRASYKPSGLCKNRVLVKSTNIGEADRRLQMRGAYEVYSDAVGVPESESVTFLIVDDVLTSGATTQEIVRAITEVYANASFYVFTLAKTLFRSDAEKASAEVQHNAQLYSDLYSPVCQLVSITKTNESSEETQIRRPTSKNFTANYSKTNHNFVIHNLPRWSIKSEPSAQSTFRAVQIIKNILQRGKPTVASRRLRTAFGLELTDGGLNTASQALISRRPVEWARLIRGVEKTQRNPTHRFLQDVLPKYLGEYAFIRQLIVPEVQIFDMTQVYVDQFQNRQVDLFVPHVGLIIEIDGAQHAESDAVDSARDAFTSKLGIKTVRISVQELESESNAFRSKIDEILSHIKRIERLEIEGSLTPPNGLTLSDYRLAYDQGVAPSDPRVRLTAAIRFQLLLLELLERGVLRLGKQCNMLLVNRDGIDFAKEALDDLNELLSNVFTLMGVEYPLLDIEINEQDELRGARDPSSIVVDFSVFERYDDSFQTNHDVIYCRTHYLDFYRHLPMGHALSIDSAVLLDYDFFELACADPIEYELDLSPSSAQRTSLRYFLQNLFLPFIDDADFREGQVGIVGSALSRQGTIGLLPTGSGKSICYQLSAVLQPAISFVVCPIKSLMYDQKADLDRIGFTRSNTITGDLNAEERERVQRDFGRGKYFFVFISPERFQTHAFRRQMSAIGLDRSFAYAVIDEAHCLSEWGHDFRTSYLNLANTIEKFAPRSSYIGLTATASVNVLKDMQAEFRIPDDNVRTPLHFTREELSFHAIDDQGRKTDEAVRLVDTLDKKWNANQNQSTGSMAGIVFTPHVNGEKGCFDLAGRLATALEIDVRYYSGSAPRWAKPQGPAFDVFKREVQDDFKASKFRLLTATKAYGMGVNKGNIAYTVHFGIPSSMEALYQEAGRAGRDKGAFRAIPADCYVLLTREKNKGSLDRVWDSSTTVAELKEQMKKLSRESDINTNLFLMTNGLDTINDEFKLMDSIYRRLEGLSGQKKIILSAREFGVEKGKFEKAVYRLSQIGIVSDWVIEDFFRGTLQIEFSCRDEQELTENIERAITKYEPGFQLDDIFRSNSKYYQLICERLENGRITKTQFVFLVLLLWSYDHFVYNRRQSLKTVYEQCSDLASGAIGEQEFKDRLEGYFEFNEASYMLHHLAENSADPRLWLSLFFEESEDGGRSERIIDEKRLLTLREQLSRFLESYKDNVCLNYLSGVIRLISDQFDDADGERRMADSIDRLMRVDSFSARTLVTDTLRLGPLLSMKSKADFARLVHMKFSDLALLEAINEEFGDAYSYRQVVTPLLSRVETITEKYKGVDW